MKNKRILSYILIVLMLFTISSSCFALDYTQLQIQYNISARSITPQYIVIHDTANLNQYANAWMHYEYFNSGNLNSSADIFIDKNKIYFINNIDKYYTWHCGDNYYNYHSDKCFNKNSIGIEMCMNDRSKEGLDSIFNKTVETTKYLMNKYKIPISNVYRHYDVTQKPCPANFPMWDNTPYINKNWVKFKESLESKPKLISMKEILNKYANTPNEWYEYLKDIPNAEKLLQKIYYKNKNLN